VSSHITIQSPALRKSRVVTASLVVAGLSAVVIGGTILFVPSPFFGSTGVELGDNPTLLSDIRGLGALLLAFGVVIAIGGFVRALAFTSALVGAVLYLAYVFARVLSIAVDGMPGSSIVAALVAELVLGLACLFVLLRYRVENVV
jgi:hypothetical protein